MEDKQKVIFIEDDPNLGLIIVLALQSKGYEVCYANTLSGIQDMIEKDCPNILLLDLEVGNQNALDYLPFIRSKHPSLPVLIASSHNEGEEITRCYEAGANHYTKKPYDIQEFAQIIGKRYHTFNRCRKRSWIYIIKKRPTLLIVIKGGLL